MDHVNYVLVLLIGLLCAVAAVAGLARRFAVSYPIVLVVFGLGCSLLPHIPRVPLPPSLVFLVILPPLLYSAAWQTSWREFKYNLVSISSLAVLLVFFTAFGVAFAAKWWLPGFNWQLGFLLGAVVSPTDAVAATSIARKVGMPQRIVDLLEGESLLNDATGLLALQFGVEMVVQGVTPTIGHGIAVFAWLTIGGALVGLAIGFVVTWLERWVDDGPVEIALSLIVPYAAYLTGEAAEGFRRDRCGGMRFVYKPPQFDPPLTRSAAADVGCLGRVGVFVKRAGVCAHRVAASLCDGRHSWTQPHEPVPICAGVFRHSGTAAPGLDVSGDRGNLVGAHSFHGADIREAESESGFCHGLDRDAWGRRPGRGQFIASYAQDGSPFPQRSLIIFLTFSLILVTLVAQGLSLPWLVRILGLTAGNAQFCEEGEARHLILQAGIDFLGERSKSATGEHEVHIYEDLLHQYQHRLEDIDECGPGGSNPEKNSHSLTTNHLLLETIRRQRQELNLLRSNGRIGDRYTTISSASLI